ncbi:carbon-nitrogen hydrolase family protein [Polluticoccus soli]|uniref:carbon-nitrogen hydrolase family protein n=1 Tax=Polluticoccus soli TaxID=3034150 RepID=UPI0023E22992|nr:carbon-nitrogen hydrolase family protein [Flavipsychrobacter sp. JY13-12]
MKIALASPPIPSSLEAGLQSLEDLVKKAASQQAEIICFPESFLPGYPGMGYSREDRTAERLEPALEKVRDIAARHAIAIIIPMDLYVGDEVFNVAHVISNTGEVLGYQTKNQLDPSEDNIWKAGTERTMFEVNGLRFGISICHEGFRYGETVRWAAQRGAHIVFHPHFTGSNESGPTLTEWGSMANPYYEKAMMVRALENTIYFASINYASTYPESASAVIAPDGSLVAHERYGNAGVLVVDIDLAKATGFLAKRLKNELYGMGSEV